MIRSKIMIRKKIKSKIKSKSMNNLPYHNLALNLAHNPLPNHTLHLHLLPVVGLPSDAMPKDM